MSKQLSVVIPVYGCAACLNTLYSRLLQVLENIAGDFEMIFVDDCANDDSWTVLAQLALKDVRVVAIRLSRNFGQHAAITAGISQSTGDWVVVMDCDLQDPPEEIPRLLVEARKGIDIVYAKRKQKKHSLLRRAAAICYAKILQLLANVNIDGEYGSFSIISRKVASNFVQFKDQDRHYLYILQWLGFNSAAIEYEHAERHSGPSSYTFSVLIKHALNGLFFQTTVLLRWIVSLGFLISALGVILAMYYVYRYLAYSSAPGWTSLAVLILVMSGVIIASLGVVALYIERIFFQVRQRPIFVIDKKING